jgi:hypothetical protein
MPFGEGRPAFNISETEVRYAMSNTKSNHAAARFLRVSYETYRKYAKLYRDSESGKSLFDLHKNISGKGLTKSSISNATRYVQHMQDIFDGKRPNVKLHDLRRKLIRYGYLEECCASCGFQERRAIDYSIPLVVDFIDGNRTNMALENLQLICFNCSYLTSKNPFNGGEPKLF